MALLTESWMLDFLLLLLSVLSTIYWYFTSTANYFRDRGIPHLPQFPLLGRRELLQLSQYEQAKFFYDAFPKERFYGYFLFLSRRPSYVIKDPELIHNVMVKDFAHFYDRAFPVFEADPLTQNLFHLRGEKWQNLRHKLVPTFTTGKMKLLFDQLKKCGVNLVSDVKEVADSGEAVEAKAFLSPFTLEVVGSTVFGLNFSKNNSASVEFSQKISEAFTQPLLQRLINYLALTFPKLVDILSIRMVPKDYFEYFHSLTLSTKEYREKNNARRNDYFQLLLDLQREEECGDRKLQQSEREVDKEDENILKYVPKHVSVDSSSKFFNDVRITGQTFTFLSAGTETISTTVCFILHHLAKDPTIQQKLHVELDSVYKKHNEWTYQSIKECTYLDQVIQESQRMYPVVALPMRECTVPYHIPDSDVVIEKGCRIAITVLGVQMDPKYYPDPEVFDPDRFADNNHRPGRTFMPFADGPRICIGMRFALLEMKVCLASVLLDYDVLPSDKTQQPFKYSKESFFPKPIGGVWVRFRKRSREPSSTRN